MCRLVGFRQPAFTGPARGAGAAAALHRATRGGAVEEARVREPHRLVRGDGPVSGRSVEPALGIGSGFRRRTGRSPCFTWTGPSRRGCNCGDGLRRRCLRRRNPVPRQGESSRSTAQRASARVKRSESASPAVLSAATCRRNGQVRTRRADPARRPARFGRTGFAAGNGSRSPPTGPSAARAAGSTGFPTAPLGAGVGMPAEGAAVVTAGRWSPVSAAATGLALAARGDAANSTSSSVDLRRIVGA